MIHINTNKKNIYFNFGVCVCVGAVRLRLQLNRKTSGMLARYGYPLRSIPVRAHAGDVVLFTPDSTGSYFVKMVTACKWVHVALVVMGHNDKLKLLEASSGGVSLHLLDARVAEYRSDGVEIGLRRLTGVARTAKFISTLIDFVDGVEGTPYVSFTICLYDDDC